MVLLHYNINTDKQQDNTKESGHAFAYQSPDSNPPLLWWWTRAQITRHVALRGSPWTVGQRLMAVLIVVILYMHLAAGDQTLAVTLTTTG